MPANLSRNEIAPVTRHNSFRRPTFRVFARPICRPVTRPESTRFNPKSRAFAQNIWFPDEYLELSPQIPARESTPSLRPELRGRRSSLRPVSDCGMRLPACFSVPMIELSPGHRRGMPASVAAPSKVSRFREPFRLSSHPTRPNQLRSTLRPISRQIINRNSPGTLGRVMSFATHFSSRFLGRQNMSLTTKLTDRFLGR
jgi:hypothetical protein